MKIIHCADLHLDSAMKTNLDREKAKKRRDEILHSFERLCDYARENEVSVIMIAGDFFDTKHISVKTKGIIHKCIEENPDIDFLYLKGNHDAEVNLYDDEIPNNLKLFTKGFTTYNYGKVKITASELPAENIYNSLILDASDINIVMLHGQEMNYVGKDKTETVNLPLLKDKNIDYLALGHIHKEKSGAIDRRGKWRYCGCLDGRGYDECGAKGFVLLTIEDGTVKDEFVEFESCMIREIRVDIKGACSTAEVDGMVSKAISEVPKEDMLKVTLCGKTGVNAMYDVDYIAEKYKDRFIAFKIDDEVTLDINAADYEKDASLKGEFIRYVHASDYPEKEERAIIESGIRALFGEE